jgi:hypothetical protein
MRTKRLQSLIDWIVPMSQIKVAHTFRKYQPARAQNLHKVRDVGMQKNAGAYTDKYLVYDQSFFTQTSGITRASPRSCSELSYPLLAP